MAGVWAYFYNYDHWHDLYAKNCSSKTSAEWYAVGHANVPLGLLYATFGIFCELIYIPFLVAMLKPEFIKYSCYKFMFLIGVIDLIVLPCNAIITGVQCALGMHFCIAPAFFFFVGAIATSAFYGATLTCVILAIDRFLEMCFPKMAKALFGDKRVFLWITIPIIYLFLTFFDIPFMYNTKRYSYFTDPFIETKFYGNPAFKELTFHCIHNVGVALLVGGIYAILVIVLKIKSAYYGNVNITKIQKLMTLQSCCICIEMWFACLVYVYNQFLPLPNLIEIIAQLCWIGIHGDTPIVYLLLNDSLRKIVFQMVIDFAKKSTKSLAFVRGIYSPRNDGTVAPEQPNNGNLIFL